MRGIILAAGCARRLDEVHGQRPKCLLKFGRYSLLQHQIRSGMRVGVEEFVVVVGYEQQQIRDHLAGSPAKIAFVENSDYASTNTLHSLLLAGRYFDDDFLYFNGDVLLDYRVTERLVADTGESTLACTAAGCDEEEVKVRQKDGRIIEIGKEIPPEKAWGEFVGVAGFAGEHNGEFLRILDRAARRRSNRNRFFEYAVNRLASSATLRLVDVTDLAVVEIDFPEDLSYARDTVYPRLAADPESGHA